MKNPINKFIQDLEKQALDTLKNLNEHLEKFPKKELEEQFTWILQGREIEKSDELKSYEEIITTEFEKCKKSPYYFATTYITIGGLPFRTYMNEEEFNNLVKYCEK